MKGIVIGIILLVVSICTSYSEIIPPDNTVSDDGENNQEVIDNKYEEQYWSDIVNNVLPDIVRPEGYDSPKLTPEVAHAIILEAWDIRDRIGHAGFKSIDQHGWDWANAPENIVKNIESPLVYYIPALDTMEKFDSYFGKVFTDNSLELYKSEYKVKEVDGKLAGINGNYMVGLVTGYTNWYDSSVIEIIQSDGSNIAKAVIDKVCCIEEVEDWGYGEFDFEYSEEYGWRIDFNSKNYLLF